MAELLINYIPCNTSKNGDYIYFYALAPNGELKRKRIYIERFKGAMRKKMATQLRKTIDLKLANGWSPFTHQEARAFTTPVATAINRYIAASHKSMRPDSIRSVNSIIGYLLKICHAQDPSMMCLDLNESSAKRIMRIIEFEKQIKETTYNNYLTWFKAFGNWCVSAGYMNVNPFQGILKKKKRPKTREVIPPEVLTRIKEYYATHYPSMLLFIDFMLYVGLRPNEILQLKPPAFNLKERTVFIDIEISKSHTASTRTIPHSMINALAAHLINTDSKHYLFSTRLKPGLIQKNSRYTGKVWASMRNKLNLPHIYTSYSCRDTGVVNMLNSGVAPQVVMSQFGHSDLKFTTIYAKHLTTTAQPDILKL